MAKKFRQKQNSRRKDHQNSHIWCQVSGNQLERALRETAKLAAKEYPLINQIVQKKNTEELALQRTDQLELVLNQGGFSLKTATFSKGDPRSNLSADDYITNVAGMKWFHNEYMVSLDVDELRNKETNRQETNARKKYHPI